MTRRIKQDDLDHLLDLIERGGARDGSASALGADAANPLWSLNHDFWVDKLKQETSLSWSEQHYIDAATIINAAEYQRVALNGLMPVLLGYNDASDTDSSEIYSSEVETIETGLTRGDLSDLSDWHSRGDDDGTSHNGPTGQMTAMAELISLREAFSAPEPVYDDSYARNTYASNSETSGNGSQPELHRSRSVSEHSQSGRPDVVAISAVRGRESGSTKFNQVRSDLFAHTGLASLSPYTSWDDFQTRNKLPDDLVDDLVRAYPEGFDTVDMWVAGLAEVSVTGAEGSTLQAAISDELSRLRGGTTEAQFHDLIGTDLISETTELSFGDIVQRHSGGYRAVAAVDKAAGAIVASVRSEPGLVIAGSDGDDIIQGRGGDDVISGGAGDDTLLGNAGNDRLAGGTGDDILKGGAGSDVLSGGVGDDTLDGGQGADVMAGGLGNDTIFINDIGDQAVEAFDAGIDAAKTTLGAYVLPENVEILAYIGDGDFIGTGNELANTVIGGAGNDQLKGNAGDDALVGGAGDDRLEGGTGTDTTTGGLGSDVHVVLDQTDVVIEYAGEGVDTIETTLSIYTLAQNVEILIFIGDGRFSGAGNELDNIIVGGSLDDGLVGAEGNDTLSGGWGNDALDGGYGDDTLDGGDGDDTVSGGQGSDYVLFTRGNDTLVLRPGFGNDVVIGFDANSSGSGSRDRIDVSAYGFSEESLGIDILIVYDGDSTLVRIGADSVKLHLVDAATMDRQSFIFGTV